MSIESLVSSFFKVREDLNVYRKMRLAVFQGPLGLHVYRASKKITHPRYQFPLV